MGRKSSLACLIAVLLAGCSRPPTIVVGSKNFTEQIILGEIVAQHLERRLHVPVDKKLNLGGTLLAHEALVAGAIDLYPEYTGTALTAILKRTPGRDPDAVFADVKAEYARRWGVAWTARLGFNNTFAMVVRRDTARAGPYETLSRAAHRPEPWTLGAGYEFLQRADGLAGLVKAYHLRLQGQPVTMDLGLLYRALESRRVDMIAANSTDGLLSVLDVVVLRDDQAYFPPYQCGIVTRDATLARFPKLKAALEELSGKISDSDMRKLNYDVDGRHEAPRETAAHWLDQAFANRPIRLPASRRYTFPSPPSIQQVTVRREQ